MLAYRAILSSTPCDSHAWNLIYIELFLKEHNFEVINLGCCVSNEDLIESIQKNNPDIVVISSVNGYLYRELLKMLPTLNKIKKLFDYKFKLVVGGKLTVDDRNSNFLKKELVKIGIDKIFLDNEPLSNFSAYLSQINTYPYLRAI